MSAQPRADARRIAPGHVRLDRPAIVPNDPAPPAPLTELWARLVDALDEGRRLMISGGVPETDAYDWWDRHYKHCQQCLRPGQFRRDA